jgi:hypothetical protein
MPGVRAPSRSPRCPAAGLFCIRPVGGRTWWAHFEFNRINIAPTILRKKIEDLRCLRASTAQRRCRNEEGQRRQPSWSPSEHVRRVPIGDAIGNRRGMTTRLIVRVRIHRTLC